jgi:hypothetical protein
VIKLICFVKRRPDLSREEFRQHWRHHHGPLIESLPEFRRHIRRYEQNCRLDEDYQREDGGGGRADPRSRSGFDGVTVQWFDAARDFFAFATEPAYRETIYTDEEKFLDRGALSFLLCEEPTSVIGEESNRVEAGVKLIAMLQRREGIDREGFRRHWSQRHASIFRDTPELARHIVGYDQQCRLDRDYDRDEGSGYDGVTEQWYASLDDFRAFVAEEAFSEKVFPDERIFLAPERTQWILTRPPDVIID